jgi:hypothetical protein
MPCNVDLRHLSPHALTAHPLNWKAHPEAQLAALGESIERHGWLKTVLWNETTGRLLNGHARVAAAAARGWATVPVWVLQVEESQERAILLEFDQIGLLRERDDLALLGLVAQVLEAGGELPVGYDLTDLQALTSAAEASLVPHFPAAKPDPEPSLWEKVGFTLPDVEHLDFQQVVTELAERWGTEGVGQTVLYALQVVAEERCGL